MTVLPPPLVLGHRGYRARFPENTMLAFREALGAGADGVECDLQKTADGQYVVIHDPTTARVADTDRDVAASTFDELDRLDVGRGEHIPTLDELLHSLPPGSWLDLELKRETLTLQDCAPIIRILDAAFPRANLMVSSFEPALLAPFRAAGFRIGLLVGEEAAARGICDFLRVLVTLRPQYVNLPVDMVGALGRRRAAAVCRTLRALGFSLLFWTANEPKEIEFALRHGRIIVSDDVGHAVSQVRGGLVGR